MSKRKAIVSDGFGDWLTGEAKVSDADSAESPSISQPSSSQQNSASTDTTVVQLTGQSRPFTAHIDTGLLLELDVVKTQLRRLTNMGAHDTSKRLILEAALINSLNDFHANGKNSFLFKYIAHK